MIDERRLKAYHAIRVVPDTELDPISRWLQTSILHTLLESRDEILRQSLLILEDALVSLLAVEDRRSLAAVSTLELLFVLLQRLGGDRRCAGENDTRRGVRVGVGIGGHACNR